MDPRILTIAGMVIGLVLAIFVGSSIGDGKMLVPFLFVDVPMFFAILAISGWQPIPLAFFCISLAGTIPLAKNLTPFNIIACGIFALFCTEYIIFRKRKLVIPNRPLFVMLFLVCCILIVNFAAGGGGIRMLGSATWGGRRYFEVFVAMMFFVVLTLWRPDMKSLNKIPYFVLAAALVDTGFWVFQYLRPGWIGFTYPFYSGLQSDLFFADSAAPGEGVNRLMGLRTLGLGIVLFCVSEHNFKTLLSTKSLLYGVVLIPAGIALTAMAGFRSYLAVALLMAAIAAILRLRTLAIVPAILSFSAIGCLSLGQGTLYELPVQIQRALSFLPGDWDPIAMKDATDSTEWRQGIWGLWYDQYFYRSPAFGRGWNIDPMEAYGAGQTGLIVEKREDTWQFHAAIGSLHNGPLTAVDAVGIVGTLLTLVASFLILRYIFKSCRRVGLSNLEPIHRWVLVSVVTWLFTFWAVDGFFYRFFPYFIVLCGLTMQAFASVWTRQKAETPATVTTDPKGTLALAGS